LDVIITEKRARKIIRLTQLTITILDVGRTPLRFGIEAPREISIRSQLKAQTGIRSVELLRSTSLQSLASLGTVRS
jgi:sRNA-binding carbon storage regulator CsrA